MQKCYITDGVHYMQEHMHLMLGSVDLIILLYIPVVCFHKSHRGMFSQIHVK